MQNPRLAGVRAKIQWAKDHFSHLDGAIRAWGSAKEEEHAHRFQYQPQRKRVNVLLENVRPIDPEWPMLVGDTVHNLRSALDHLVCQLAILAGHSVDCCTKTSFPVCVDARKFKESSRPVKQLIDVRAFTLIEQLQRYRTPNTPKDILRVLSQLDNIDKHRVLVVAGKRFRTKGLKVRVNKGESISVPVATEWKPLKDGAQVGTIDIDDVILKRQLIFPPEYEISVDTETEIQVVFDETGCCDGMPVQYVLVGCISRVSDIVWLFGRQFFGE